MTDFVDAKLYHIIGISVKDAKSAQLNMCSLTQYYTLVLARTFPRVKVVHFLTHYYRKEIQQGSRVLLINFFCL